MLVSTTEAAEELDSISAIFPELLQDPQDPCHAALDLEVSPTTPLEITFKSTFTLDSVKSLSIYAEAQIPSPSTDITANGLDDQHRSHKFSHLPPLHVDVNLPRGYPEAAPPMFHLSTLHDWLPPSILRSLEGHAQELWEEYGHTQTVYAYIDYLQTCIESSFHIPACTLTLSTSIEESLLAYQAHALRSNFEAQTYDCGVCLYPKKGSACHAMRGCGHVFCHECLQDFYNSAITEGSVETVQCLDPSCGKNIKLRPKPVHPTELLAIGMTTSQVQRYVELKLKKKLETDKTTVFCPRPWCQGPARNPKYQKFNTADLEHWPEEDDSDGDSDPATSEFALGSGGLDIQARLKAELADRLRICAKCTYAFCRVCHRSWHGDFVDCRPADPTDISADDKASLDFIRLNTSPCPSCSVATQKRQGCNHMICARCDMHFCYLCSSWLNPRNPYSHFNTRGEGCYQRLWELEEGDEGQGAHFGGARAAEIAWGAEAPEGAAGDGDGNGHDNGAAEDEVDRDGLQRFVQMAAADIEDEWDSDELDVRPFVRFR